MAGLDHIPISAPRSTLIATCALISLVVYLVALAVYRLYLSPIAKFPGPKLAALTQWVETYYELKSPGGQFGWVYRKWHEQYGNQMLHHLMSDKIPTLILPRSYNSDRSQRATHPRFNVL